MLDLKALRRDPDAARAALARRGGSDAETFDRVLVLDERRREILPQLEGLRAEQNAASQAIGKAQKARKANPPAPGSQADADAAIAAMRDVAARAKALQEELTTVEAQLQESQARLPNLPHPDAPPRDTVIRTVGEPAVDGLDLRANAEGEASSAALDHLQIAGPDRVDMERGARLSGSRFAYLRGDLVFLELALVQWALSKLRGHGHEAVVPPVLVREEALYGTGFLPDTEQQIYTLPDDELFLVGTSEVALASMHAGEILEGDSLPRRYAGFSPCFRREAGAAGSADRGIFRVHQFDKVEMFSFVPPEQAEDEHARLLAIEEEILGDLGIPYRVVDIAVDDLGSSAARKFDCEAWLPSQEQYRELTSTSNTTDYQARRLGVRYRPEGGKPETMATLNGTAIAVGRTIIALLEHGLREDGTVVLPECLVPFGAPAVLPAA
ncbi:Seryl-tRNA synthetase [Patulibacter medicamentivorans]|uniref:Serine--tRNA ligase n=1 Tax=Patulibacter medicamentivorans TaxID=1097667 RepID=H0E132_9ACTN|nr:serine--tRNA ligase [Patulibacter medicamentivorans]EHN12607.1 Seryl-tRNA synthetase [Patulibacter medicamentivorans]